MAYTKEQLATATLRQMGLVPVGDSPAPENASFVKDVYDQKLAEWRDRGLVYWPNTDDSTAEIPVAVFQPLVMLLANWVGPSFGKAAALEEQVAREEMLLKPLRRHVARAPTGLPLRVEYF